MASAAHGIMERVPPAVRERYAEVHIKQMLREAIAHLSDREQTVLGLYYFEGMTASQVADVLGIDESVVDHLLELAVVRMRGYVQSHYPDVGDLLEVMSRMAHRSDELDQGDFLAWLADIETQGLLNPPATAERPTAADLEGIEIGEDAARLVTDARR